MDNLQVTVSERLTWAMGPGSLALLRGPKIGRAEYLIALGWAGIHHRTASKLYRLVHSIDRQSYPEALRAVECLVAHLASRRKWPVKPHRFHEIAKNALDFVLSPACPHCFGRGYMEFEGTGRLSAHACPSCQGSGRRRVATKHLSEVVAELEQFEDIVTRGVSAKLRG